LGSWNASETQSDALVVACHVPFVSNYVIIMLGSKLHTYTLLEYEVIIVAVCLFKELRSFED